MIETGLHVIYNTTARLHYAVDVQETYAGIAVFEPCQEGQTAPNYIGALAWHDLKAALEEPQDSFNKAGFVDLEGNGVFVPDLPGCPHGAIYKGRSYIFLDGMVGHDELTDYALIDIMTDNSGFPCPGATALRSRLARRWTIPSGTELGHRRQTPSSSSCPSPGLCPARALRCCATKTPSCSTGPP